MYLESYKMKSLSLNKLAAALIFALSTGTLSLLIGSTTAHADNKNTLKDAIGNGVIVAEAKTGQVKPAEIQAADIKSGEVAKSSTDPDFKMLDSNHDDKISAKEAAKDKNLYSIFDAVDTNHDGGLSANEYASFKSAMSNSKSPEALPTTN